MIKGIINFFDEKDPDLVCFCQAFSMFLANIIGAAIWLLRFPCSSLIITGPGIIAAIIYTQFGYRKMTSLSFLSGILTAVFMMFIIMTKQYYGLQIIFTFVFIYFLFSSSKTRYVISFSIVPCVLAFNMHPGAQSAVDRIIESILSSVLALISVFIVRELFYETRVRRILIRLINSIENDIETKAIINPSVDKLFFLCVKTINHENYFFKGNKRFAQKTRPAMYRIIKSYKNFKILERYDTEVKSVLCRELYEIKLSLKKGKPISPETYQVKG